MMSADTAAHRYTCDDCRKTYRSFRSREEWHKSHVAQVCTARPGARTAVPGTAPERPNPAPPAAKAAPPVSAKAAPPAARSGSRVSAPPAPSAQQQRLAPEGSRGRPGHLDNAVSFAAAGIAALVLVAVALDSSRTILDATSAGSPPLRFLLAALIAGPCLYGAYRMARSGMSALPGKNPGGPDRSPVGSARS